MVYDCAYFNTGATMRNSTSAEFDRAEADMQREIERIRLDARNGSLGQQSIDEGRSCFASLRWLHEHLPFAQDVYWRL
jgi:hypothetical protein